MGTSEEPYVASIPEDVGSVGDPETGCDIFALGFDPTHQMCFSLQIPRWFYVAIYTTYAFCGSGKYHYETATLAYELECQVPYIWNPSDSRGWYYTQTFSTGIRGAKRTVVDHAGPVEPGIFIIVDALSDRRSFTQMQMCWHHDRADRGCAYPGGGISVGYGR